MQSLRTPIPARHTPPLLAANPAPRPLASCKVCVPIIMVLRDYYPKVCENSTRDGPLPRWLGMKGTHEMLARQVCCAVLLSLRSRPAAVTAIRTPFCMLGVMSP